MGQAIFALGFAAVLATLYFQRWLFDAIREAVENFRGGPPAPPMHPLPADDSRLLRRGLSKRARRNQFPAA